MSDDWKEQKKRQKAIFTTQQNLPYEVKVRRAELRAREFIQELDRRGMNAHVSEGGQREEALVEHGCNYFGKSVIRSAPFAPFLRQDLLQLALDLDVQVPEIYGEIARKADGTLYTTKAQRTGCSMCGFGVHLEKRPHRFDMLRERNEKEWEFWMYRCCTDPETGERFGWGRVLDYIGVRWEDKWEPEPEQLEFHFC
jgi:hypothetical protein